jgi:hypothetical protein
MKTLASPIGLALVSVFLLGAPAIVRSQGIPPGAMPTPQEIERRISEEFDKLPDRTSEIEGAKLTYKAIPTDAAEALRQTGQLPSGMDADELARHYGAMVRPSIEKYCGRVGKLALERPLKSGSVKIPPGEYTFGLVMQNLLPVAVAISGGALKAPLQVPLKQKNPPAAPHATAEIELKAGKAKNEFTIAVGFGKVEGEAGKFVLQKN